jgi:hypothetical protein
MVDDIIIFDNLPICHRDSGSLMEQRKSRPPQFVFDVIVGAATHQFVIEDLRSEDIVRPLVADLAELYDPSEMFDDILQGMRRILLVLGKRRVSSVPLILESYVWYRANFETREKRRSKTSLFHDLGEGRYEPVQDYAPVDNFTRVTGVETAFKAYLQCLLRDPFMVKPREWSPMEEKSFGPLMSILYGAEEQSRFSSHAQTRAAV